MIAEIVGQGQMYLIALMAALWAPVGLICGLMSVWKRRKDAARFAAIMDGVRADAQIKRDGLMDPETGEIFNIKRFREVTNARS